VAGWRQRSQEVFVPLAQDLAGRVCIAQKGDDLPVGLTDIVLHLVANISD
jgi:hypothetical protein